MRRSNACMSFLQSVSSVQHYVFAHRVMLRVGALQDDLGFVVWTSPEAITHLGTTASGKFLSKEGRYKHFRQLKCWRTSKPQNHSASARASSITVAQAGPLGRVGCALRCEFMLCLACHATSLP